MSQLPRERLLGEAEVLGVRVLALEMLTVWRLGAVLVAASAESDQVSLPE
jgi:hypothetical protein